jgi:hypothetical protein
MRTLEIARAEQEAWAAMEEAVADAVMSVARN